MSGPWSWFGGGAARKDSPKDAIIALREQLGLLQKRDRHLESQMNEQHAIARQNVTTNKAVAKKALERRKLYQSHREQTEKHIATLEQQVIAIDSANINRETLVAMERAAGAIKQIHGKLTPEKVDETMEKLREQNAIDGEIAEAMNNMNISNPDNEAELEAELEGLEQQLLDEEILKISNVNVPDTLQGTPKVANADLPGKDSAKEDSDIEAELRQLQAEMA